MKKIVITIILFVSLYAGYAANPKANFNVIPLPRTIEVGSSAPFILNNRSKIYYEEGEERNASFLQQYIFDITGLKLKLTDKSQKNNVVSLVSKNNISGNSEKYILTVNKKEISITGNSSAGVFYGIQTLQKALPVIQTGKVEIPSSRVEDCPRFSYRGVHLDVARHFFPVDSIKKYIDILYIYDTFLIRRQQQRSFDKQRCPHG